MWIYRVNKDPGGWSWKPEFKLVPALPLVGLATLKSYEISLSLCPPLASSLWNRGLKLWISQSLSSLTNCGGYPERTDLRGFLDLHISFADYFSLHAKMLSTCFSLWHRSYMFWLHLFLWIERKETFGPHRDPVIIVCVEGRLGGRCDNFFFFLRQCYCKLLHSGGFFSIT